MNPFVEKIPIATTALAVALAGTLFAHWRRCRQPQLAWWTLGTICFGTGTLMESLTALGGWSEAVFRLWYICGALLGAAPLAQGTVYLLKPREVADRYAAFLVALAGGTAACAWLSPLDATVVNRNVLSAALLEWQWVRWFSPVLNLYALWFLAGGAAWSAWQYQQRQGPRARFLGNCLIAIGAFLPGIGGAAARFRSNGVLYVTEFIGLALIAMGYWIMRHEKDDPDGREVAPAGGSRA